MQMFAALKCVFLLFLQPSITMLEFCLSPLNNIIKKILAEFLFKETPKKGAASLKRCRNSSFPQGSPSLSRVADLWLAEWATDQRARKNTDDKRGDTKHDKCLFIWFVLHWRWETNDSSSVLMPVFLLVSTETVKTGFKSQVMWYCCILFIQSCCRGKIKKMFTKAIIICLL